MPSMQRLTDLDWQLSDRIAVPHETRFLRLSALIIAHSGDSLLWLLGAAAALIRGNTIWRDFGWRVLTGTIAAGAVTTALKWLFRRQRPPGKGLGFYTQFDRHAFPSGHASRTACLAVLVSPLLPPWGPVLLSSWAGLVGLARVALQVHFASDVIGGWTVGLLVGLLLQQTF
jgi:undecaprenyl-diphosphatase